MIIFIIVWFSLIAVLGIVFLVLKSKNKNAISATSNDQDERAKKARKKRFAEYIQSFYKRTPWIRGIYSKTYNRLTPLYPADITEIHKLTTQMVSHTLIICFFIVAFGVLTSGGSVIYIASFFFIAYICTSLLLDTQLEKYERNLLEGFFKVIPRINKEYEKTKILDVAIYNVYLGISGEVSFKKKNGLFSSRKVLKTSNNAIVGYHLQRIHSVLTAPASRFDFELQKYISSAPNQYLTMFISICRNIKINGDVGLRTGNGSELKKRLNELQELVSDEINNTEKLYHGMKFTPYVALASLAFIQPFKLFSLFALPDIASFFDSSFWAILVCSVFAVAYLVHKYIMKIKSPFEEKQITESIWYKIIQGEPILYVPSWMPRTREKYLNRKLTEKGNNFINRTLTKYQQKNYSKCERIARQLRKAGEKLSVKMYLLKKITFFVGGFALAILLSINGTIKDKMLAVPVYTQAFEEALAPSESYKELMSQVATDIANQSGRKVRDTHTITEMVLQDGRVNRPDMAETIANEIVSQNENYASIYFKWYYLIIATIVGGIMFYIPDFFLQKQMQMAELIKEDEVNQFRSIISLHMENGSTTVRTLLYDMQKFAQYYKEPISKCIIDMDVNQRKALVELKKADAEDSTFADIVDGLINVSVAGVAKSFESIKAEKSFYRENRKIKIDRINTEKINKAQKLCMIPSYVTIFLTLFVPLGLKAFSMFSMVGL